MRHWLGTCCKTKPSSSRKRRMMILQCQEPTKLALRRVTKMRWKPWIQSRLMLTLGQTTFIVTIRIVAWISPLSQSSKYLTQTCLPKKMLHPKIWKSRAKSSAKSLSLKWGVSRSPTRPSGARAAAVSLTRPRSRRTNYPSSAWIGKRVPFRASWAREAAISQAEPVSACEGKRWAAAALVRKTWSSSRRIWKRRYRRHLRRPVKI